MSLPTFPGISGTEGTTFPKPVSLETLLMIEPIASIMVLIVALVIFGSDVAFTLGIDNSGTGNGKGFRLGFSGSGD